MKTNITKNDVKRQRITRATVPLFDTVAYDYDAKFNMFNHLPNPNTIIASAGDRVATFDNIKNDPHVASCIQTRKSGLTAYEYEVQSSNQAIKDFCDYILSEIDVKSLIDNITDAVLYGYSVIEINYAYSNYGGRTIIAPATIQQKPFHWFRFDQYNLCRFTPINNPQGILLPPKKFIVTQNNPTYKNPYGEAILSRCLWSVIFKKSNMAVWMKFVEKFGMPHFVGKTNTLNEVAYQNMLDQLDGLIQEASAVISSEDSIESLNSTAAQSSQIFTDLITFCNTEISKAILSETLTTELTSTGSYAAGKVHENVLYSVVDSDRKLAEKGINDLLAWLVDFNFNVPDEDYPNFIMYPPNDVDEHLANVTDTLTKNGTIQFTKKYYVDRFGFNEDEFEIIEKTNSQLPTAFAASASDNVAFANPKPEERALTMQAIADMIAEYGKDIAEKDFEKLIKQIAELIENYNTYEELTGELASVLPKIDTDIIEKTLASTLIPANVLGHLASQTAKINLNPERIRKVITKCLEDNPNDITKFLAGQEVKVTWNATEMQEAIRKHAFTVSKVASADLLEMVRADVVLAQHDGKSLGEFKKGLKIKLMTSGFSTKNDGSAWRLDTILRTNTQSMYMQGCYNEMKQNADSMPYWQFMADLDSRTTNTCRELNGKVFKASDPFWNTHYPPLHYNCRSAVIALGDTQMERFGLKVEDGKNYENEPVAKGFENKPGEWTPDLSKYSKDIKKEIENIL